MKKLTVKIISIFALIIMFAIGAMACSSSSERSSSSVDTGSDTNSGDLENSGNDVQSPPETVTVTFIQTGYENKVYTINYGEPFTNIPTVNIKKGYTVVWETVNLSSVKGNIEIHAVETPNAYTVYYELGMENAKIKNSITKVSYDTTYLLEYPICEGYKFLGWKIKGTNSSFSNSGKYIFDSDLTLVAQWEIDEQSPDGWLPPV